MNYKKFFISLALPLLAGFIGSILTMPASMVWYSALRKPIFSPPDYIFGLAWTVFYILIGLALYLIWHKKRVNQAAIAIFIFQFALNVFWPVIFFGLRNVPAAFVELCILWLAIVWTILVFYKISRPAAWLLLPYLLWVSFAGYLNFMIWQLNKI